MSVAMVGRVMVRGWILLALAFGGAGMAQAQNFDFSYTNSGVSVMGTFVTTSQGNNTYLITNILNGFRGTSAITLLAPNAYESNDNILKFPANQGYFNLAGFSYRANGINYNTYFNNNEPSVPLGYNEVTVQNGSTAANNVQVSAAVPAPLPGGGLPSFLALGLATLGYHRETLVGRVRLALARRRSQPSVLTA